MDRRFFQPSLAGTRAFALYLLGYYSEAATGYREHYSEAIREGWTSGDPSQDALLQGDLQRAKTLANQTIERSPGNIAGLLNLGEVAIEEKQYREALALFSKVLEKERDQFDALLLSSVAQAHLGAYREAMDSVNRALRYWRVEVRIASFLLALKTTGDLASRPKAQRPLCLLAHYYRYLRIFDRSNARTSGAYAKAAIAAGDHPDNAHLNLGTIAYRENKKEQALKHFLKAIDLNPKNALAYRWAAWVYSGRGDLPNEYRMLKAAYETAPQDPFYTEGLGHFLRDKLGDYQQALTLSLKALEKNPRNVAELGWAGYLYGALGDEERAVEYYEKAIHVAPRNPFLHESLGTTLREMGRTEEAIQAYQKSISIEPRRPSPHARLGYMYAMAGHSGEAKHHYEQAFRYGEKDLASYETLCGLYHQLGEFEHAATCFERLLSVNPDNAAARHLYSYTLRNLREKTPK
jgi:tetratricopeptide (TPR) repeat protein